MDKPADPATPFREVYQHFLAVLKQHGRTVADLVAHLGTWLAEAGIQLERIGAGTYIPPRASAAISASKGWPQGAAGSTSVGTEIS
jgi:hypothetical protein